MIKYGWIFLVIFTFGCQSTEPDYIPLPTKVTLEVRHHDVPIQNLPVYLKYNSIEFPGYFDPEDWADTSAVTDIDGRISFAPLPEGDHWIVATGIDSIPLPHTVYGSLPFSLNITSKPVLDTIIYVSE